MSGLVVGSVFLLVGTTFIAIGMVLRRRMLAFLANAVSTLGRVVKVESRSSHDSEDGITIYYYPVVEYKTRQGQRINFTSPVGSNPSSYRVGQEVKVLYNPKKTDDARIHSFLGLWLTPTVFLTIGGGSLLFGIISIVVGLMHR